MSIYHLLKSTLEERTDFSLQALADYLAENWTSSGEERLRAIWGWDPKNKSEYLNDTMLIFYKEDSDIRLRVIPMLGTILSVQIVKWDLSEDFTLLLEKEAYILKN